MTETIQDESQERHGFPEEIERMLGGELKELSEGDFRVLGLISATAILNDDRDLLRLLEMRLNRGSAFPGETGPRLVGMHDVVATAGQYGMGRISEEDFQLLSVTTDSLDFKEGVEITDKHRELEMRGLIVIRQFMDITSIEITPRGKLARSRFATKDTEHPVTW
jgi:hypothetical protein